MVRKFGSVMWVRARWVGTLLLIALLPAGAALGEEARTGDVPIASSDASPDTPESRLKMNTLISGDVESGGFGGPSVTYTRIVGGDALMAGGRGAWLINHYFALGGSVQGLIPIGAPFVGPSGAEYDLRMGYGGLWLNYILFPEQLVHCSISSIIGLGWLNRNAGEGVFETDLIFVVEPLIMAEFNVTSFFRIGAGVSYRYVGGVDVEGLRSSDLSGFGGNIVLMFGSF